MCLKVGFGFFIDAVFFKKGIDFPNRFITTPLDESRALNGILHVVNSQPNANVVYKNSPMVIGSRPHHPA